MEQTSFEMIHTNKCPIEKSLLSAKKITKKSKRVQVFFIQRFINLHHVFTAEDRHRCVDCEFLELETSRKEGHVQTLFLLSLNGCQSGLDVYV